MMKFTLETIQYINLFENLTNSKVKDCFFKDDTLIFLVEEGNVKKALVKLPRLRSLLKKEVKILGYSDDPVKFINNLLYPTKVKNILVDQDKVVISCFDTKSKGKVFGRDKENLAWITQLLKKYQKINSVSVE